MKKSKPILFSELVVNAILENRKRMTRRIVKLPSWSTGDFNDLEFVNDEDGFCASIICDNTGCSVDFECPFGRVGDELWVKETYYEYGYWSSISELNFQKSTSTFVPVPNKKFMYSDNLPDKILTGRTQQLGYYKRPSLFMPRKASRIVLEITNIRLESLHDISEEDAKNEGIETKPYGDFPYFCTIDYEWAEKHRKRGSDFKPGYCADTGSQFRDSFKSLWRLINGKDSWDLNPIVWVLEFKKKEVK